MLWLWILGGILLLLFLLCLLRVGVRVSMGEQMTVFLQIGPVRIRLYPSKKEKKSAAPEKTEKNSTTHKKMSQIPKPAFSDIKDAWRTLKPALVKALRRTRRGIRIHPLDVSVTIGGREDPAGAAENYGYAQAAVWTVMPALEQLLVIPAPHIHIGVDFDADKLCLRGEAGVSARVGTLLLVAMGIAVPALSWLNKYCKRKRAESKTNHRPAEDAVAA